MYPYYECRGLSLEASSQSKSEFERVRVVGKGAYGMAVLYRKVQTWSLAVFVLISCSVMTTPW